MRAAPASLAAPVFVSGAVHTAPAPGPTADDRWLRISELASAATSTASTFTPLADGDAAWDARMALIQQARSSVVTLTYCIEPNAHGLAYVDGLIAARERGVDVVLTLDSFGMIGLGRLSASAADMQTLYAKLARLEAVGGHVAWTGTFLEQLKGLGHGNHFKCLVVDGTRALMGGRNIGTSYVKDWGDFEGLVTGPIATQLGAAALALSMHANPKVATRESPRAAHAAAYDGLLHRLADRQLVAADRQAVAAATSAPGRKLGARVAFVLGEPHHNDNAIREALIRKIDSTDGLIVLSSNFFNAPPELLAHLLAAAKRGVDVKIVTNGPGSFVSSLGYLNTQRTFRALANAGVEVYETTRTEHSKCYFFENKNGTCGAAFGSYNSEPSADSSLVEGMLFSDDELLSKSVRDKLLDTLERHAKLRSPTDLPNLWSQPLRRALAWLLRRTI